MNVLHFDADQLSQQKPNCCFSKQLGYCSCMTILPMLIQRMQYSRSIYKGVDKGGGARGLKPPQFLRFIISNIAVHCILRENICT